MVEELDGTRNDWGWCKQKLGANAILAVSLAVARAGADPNYFVREILNINSVYVR